MGLPSLPPLPPLLRTLPGWRQRRRALQVLAAAGLVMVLRPWWPVSLLPGWLVGLLLLILRLSKLPAVGPLVAAYVQLFQGIPLLVQLFLIFFGAPVIGIEISPWVAAGVALVLNTSAFLGEIWRGCIDAVPRGQWLAADSLGMTLAQSLSHVIGPQALRIAVAPTVGFLVQVIKGTALASVIGFMELTKVGKTIANATFSPFNNA